MRSRPATWPGAAAPPAGGAQPAWGDGGGGEDLTTRVAEWVPFKTRRRLAEAGYVDVAEFAAGGGHDLSLVLDSPGSRPNKAGSSAAEGTAAAAASSQPADARGKRRPGDGPAWIMTDSEQQGGGLQSIQLIGIRSPTGGTSCVVRC